MSRSLALIMPKRPTMFCVHTYVSVCMYVCIPLCGGKAHILPVTLLRRAHRLAGTRPIDVRIVSLQGVPAEIYRILGNPVDK